MKSMNKILVIMEGIKVGLKAFILTYLIAFVMSLVINISIINQIQDYLQGTLSQDIGFNFGNVIRMTSVIMNASLFNTTGTIQIGLLVFVLLPAFSFFLAGRFDNKTEGMDGVGFMIYTIAALIYTLLILLISAVTQGELLGVEVEFISLRNGFMTFTVAMLLQLAIGMNYNVNLMPGVLATRWMVRLSFGTMSILAAIGLLVAMLGVTKNISVIILGLIVLVPNLAVYGFFLMLGINLEFNDALRKLLAYVDVDLSYDTIPLAIRITLIVTFVLFTLFAVSKINPKNYLKGLIGYGLMFPMLTLLVAYCTTIDLGVVRGVIDVRLGINPVQAFVYPLVVTFGVGFMYLFYRDFIRVVKK